MTDSSFYDEFNDEIRRLLEDAYKDKTYPPGIATEGLQVKKYGMYVPITLEQLLNTNQNNARELVPTGSKTLQRIGWFIGLLKYKLWRKLEKSLEKHRAFSGVSGYDWDDALYSEFKQKTKLVEEKEEK